MTESMRRFVIAFFASVALLLVPAIMLSFYVGPVDGDIARIGHFAERDFGMLAPPSPIDSLPEPGPSEAADLVVIGDSFSRPNRWQSEVVRNTGLRVVTYSYKSVECTGDWIEKAISGQLRPGVKTVIVESVARELQNHFVEPANCPRSFYPQHPVPVGTERRPRSWDGLFPMDISHVWATAAQHFRTHDVTGRIQSGQVVSVELTRDDLFTSRKPDRLLYFIDDERRARDLSVAEVGALLNRIKDWRARAAQAGVQLHLMVIPDKLSVYWPHIRADQQPANGEQLFDMIGEALGSQYNLLPYMREQAVLQKDLYAPNNSHTSYAGFRALATPVTRWIEDSGVLTRGSSATSAHMARH